MLETLSVEEIEKIVNQSIYHDDYAWNKEKKYSYDIGENGAEHLEDLLFWCPKCNRQHVMKGEGNKFYCTECGNGMTLTDTYEMVALDDTCVIPQTQTEWFNMQREVIKKEIQDENFTLTAKVKIGVLPEYEPLKNQATSQIVGEGVLTLDRRGLHFNGVKSGEEYSFFVESKNLPTYGMCTDLSRFYTFVDEKFIEFYPEENVVEKFFLATEELHRKNGGKWQLKTE